MYEFSISSELVGLRLDLALTKLFPAYSRNRLQQWIKNGHVLLNGQAASPKTIVLATHTLVIVPPVATEQSAFQAQPLNLNLVYEDSQLIVINKPPGLVVHPAAGNWEGTLLNGLLHHCPALNQLTRAGIVHRLDKDTSGLMVVAKTLTAQTDLVRQLQARTVKRVYRAIVNGQLHTEGVINAAIGRDPYNRLRMTTVKTGGKTAITHIKVLARYPTHSEVECHLETGRTHQIRVHLRSLGHPITGDVLYGKTQAALPAPLATHIKTLGRQALHATALSLIHPETKELCSWQCPLPNDMRQLLAYLRQGTSNTHTIGHSNNEDDKDWT